MDQEQASEALNPSTTLTAKRLNAEAPEFVPRSAAPPPSPPPLLQPMYVRPPPFVPPLPPPYYGFENCYQHDATPFYGYNVNSVGHREYAPDGNNVGTAASAKNGVLDAHQKIVNQVEFYFSDINLATTDQLFRFMSKDPEGFVPLSVVASFKKIKTGITDSTQLASILRSSSKLLVSEDGKMVKRQHPLTESDMEELQGEFNSYLPPQSSNGVSPASRTGKGDKLHFVGKYHAFVEYESVEVAEKAVAELPDESNWRNGLKVRLMLDSAVKSTSTWTKKVDHEGQSSGKKDEATLLEMHGSKENHLEDELQLEDNAKGNAQKKVRNNKGKGKGQVRGWPQQSTNGGITLVSPLQVYESTEKPSMAKPSAVPRMPDGTKGFSMGRGKPLAIKIA